MPISPIGANFNYNVQEHSAHLTGNTRPSDSSSQGVYEAAVEEAENRPLNNVYDIMADPTQEATRNHRW